MYFETRDLAAITLFAALWGVLNVTISPVFFQIFHLPFACDLIGFSALILAVWWSRKIGTATFVGFIALIINLVARPAALQFFGFFAASIMFDVLTSLGRHHWMFDKKLIGSTALFAFSVLSASLAGLIIGSFFMQSMALARWGGVLGWVGLHAVGGVIGGIIGVSIMNALSTRGIDPGIESKRQIRA